MQAEVLALLALSKYYMDNVVNIFHQYYLKVPHGSAQQKYMLEFDNMKTWCYQVRGDHSTVAVCDDGNVFSRGFADEVIPDVEGMWLRVLVLLETYELLKSLSVIVFLLFCNDSIFVCNNWYASVTLFC